MESSVAEIHAYPVRPDGFEEPLFPTRESRLEVAEHLLRAPWLGRASALAGGGLTAHARREQVVFGDAGVFWAPGGRRKRRRVVGVLDRWREVGHWWDEAKHVNRLVSKVLLSNGAVVDLAQERPGGWFLVGVED